MTLSNKPISPSFIPTVRSTQGLYLIVVRRYVGPRGLFTTDWDLHPTPKDTFIVPYHGQNQNSEYGAELFVRFLSFGPIQIAGRNSVRRSLVILLFRTGIMGTGYLIYFVTGRK